MFSLNWAMLSQVPGSPTCFYQVKAPVWKMSLKPGYNQFLSTNCRHPEMF